MKLEDCKVGMKVLFGRSQGEQTLGTIIKVNPQKLKVRQEESRGTMRSYPIGSVWTVPPSLCQAAGAVATVTAQAPAVVQAPTLKVGQTVEFEGCSWADWRPTTLKGVITKINVDGSYDVYGGGHTQCKKLVKATGTRAFLDIARECQNVYNSLSPECLTCDGERSRSEVTRIAAELNRALKALFIEAGRQISEDEAYRAETENVEAPKTAANPELPILEEILSHYAALSPQNLYREGADFSAVPGIVENHTKALKALFTKYGSFISQDDAFAKVAAKQNDLPVVPVTQAPVQESKPRFKIGDLVTFQGTRNRTLTGKVIALNVKTVSINTEKDGNWRVPFGGLRHAV